MWLRWIASELMRQGGADAVRDLQAKAFQTVAEGIREASRADATQGATRPAGMIECDVAFLFAYASESGGVVSALEERQTTGSATFRDHLGKLDGKSVVVVEVGSGLSQTEKVTNDFLACYKPRWVVSAGFAAGLDSTFKRGQIVVAERVIATGASAIDCSLRLSPQEVEQSKVAYGTLHSTQEPLSSVENKKSLGATSGAIAADQESYGVARACREKGVSFLAIRILTEGLEDELPSDVATILGKTDWVEKVGSLTGAAFQRLSAMKDLYQVGEDALRASEKLAKFLKAMTPQLK